MGIVNTEGEKALRRDTYLMSACYDSALCNVPFSHYLIESSKTLQGAIVTLSLMKLKLRSRQ